MNAAHGTRVLSSGGAAKLCLPKATVVVKSGDREGLTRAIGAAGIVIGSGDEADLRIEDTAVSSRHCQVSATPRGIELIDLASTNGTFVDDRRILGVILDRTTTVRAGESVFDVVLEEGESEVEISRAQSFGGLLGHAPCTRAALLLLERAAKSDATVLITGESGTGKELAARALHDRSARAGGPFVVLDCGAASASLLEAQLFGHAKGAFTGANEAREGVFEAADGGTLVLDELGELPLDLQPKLLRALESRTVVRLGETRSRKVDVRFVASTHRDLEHEVTKGRFRQDLYYRVGVVTVRMPALRERREEIPRLFRHFLTKIAGDAAPEVPESLLAVLAAHDWPGNVRELRNFAERFLVLRELAANELRARQQTTSPRPGAPGPEGPILPFHDAKRDHLEEFERAYFEALLAKHADNLSEAARVAGLSRQTCYRMIQKHGLGGD